MHSKEKTKKVLFIAYLFPPIANSGTQRSVKFAKYIPEFGWKPIVLTVEHGPESNLDASLLNEVASELRVERVPYRSLEIARWISRYCFFIRDKDRLISALEWRIRSLWRLPDMMSLWRPSAVRKAVKIYKKDKFDLIYASGAPWSSFLVASQVSKKTGVPYILDYRDLWTNIETGWDTNPFYYSLINRMYEKRAVKAASGIVSVTEPFIEKLQQQFSTHGKKNYACITNGFDSSDYPEHKLSRESDCFTISYTGVWKGGYGPGAVFEAVSQLKLERPELKIVLDTAGFPPGKAQQYHLADDQYKERGYISHEQALLTMLESDLVFLPVAEGEYAYTSLPGKMFEYIGSSTPILASVPKHSQVYKMLGKTGGAICVPPNDVAAIKSAILNLIENKLSNMPKRNMEVISQLERSNLTSKLVEFFNEITR